VRSRRTLLAIRNARIGAEGVGAALRSRWATVSVAACRVGSAAAATELREAANGGFRAATGSVEVPAQLDGAQAVLGRAVFTDPNRAPVPRRADGSAPVSPGAAARRARRELFAHGTTVGLPARADTVPELAGLPAATGDAAAAAVVVVGIEIDARAVAAAS